MSLTAALRYRLHFHAYHLHMVHVHLSFTAPKDDPTVWLPTWLAGSYLIREFAKHISHVHYGSADACNQRAIKLDKHTWQLTGIKAGETVSVSYPIYCYDLSVRTTYVDNTRIFGNFSSLLLMPDTLEHAACEIELHAEAFLQAQPESVLACGLQHSEQRTGIYVLHQLADGSPLSAFAALDFPFEIAPQTQLSFDVYQGERTYRHRFFVSGYQKFDHTRLCTDVHTICQSYAQLLHWMPFDDYTFMAYATSNAYGGLEHINSSALMVAYGDLPSLLEKHEPSSNYQRLLGLISHEYFHAWWVKSVRPDVMMHSQLKQEAYTTLLWVFEGFTSYVDDLLLYVSGVINAASYLQLVSDQINRYLNTHGRHVQSVAESSFDAWIKLYRPDENSANSSVSYYNKGALIALCLDLMIAQHSQGKRSLFDVIRHFIALAKTGEQGRYGMTVDALDAVIDDYLPTGAWQVFRAAHIYGVAELPILTLLDNCGITVNQHQKSAHPFGIYCEPSPQGLKINRIHPDGAAAAAGLSAQDIIVAIDGLKAEMNLLAQQALMTQAAVQTTQIHVFRRDVLMLFSVSAADDVQQTSVTLSMDGDSSWLQRERFFVGE